MPIKKMLLISTICCLIGFLGTTGMAQEWGWYKCNVLKTGIGGGRFLVRLSGNGIDGTDGAIDQWFEFHPSVTDSNHNLMVAHILTAVTTGSQVEVLVIPETTQSLYALYLLP